MTVDRDGGERNDFGREGRELYTYLPDTSYLLLKLIQLPITTAKQSQRNQARRMNLSHSALPPDTPHPSRDVAGSGGRGKGWHVSGRVSWGYLGGRQFRFGALAEWLSIIALSKTWTEANHRQLLTIRSYTFYSKQRHLSIRQPNILVIWTVLTVGPVSCPKQKKKKKRVRS